MISLPSSRHGRRAKILAAIYLTEDVTVAKKKKKAAKKSAKKKTKKKSRR